MEREEEGQKMRGRERGKIMQSLVQCCWDFGFILRRWESWEFFEPRTHMTGFTFLKVSWAAELRKDCRKASAEQGVQFLQYWWIWCRVESRGTPWFWPELMDRWSCHLLRWRIPQEDQSGVKRESGVRLGTFWVWYIHNYPSGDGKKAAE